MSRSGSDPSVLPKERQRQRIAPPTEEFVTCGCEASEVGDAFEWNPLDSHRQRRVCRDMARVAKKSDSAQTRGYQG